MSWCDCDEFVSGLEVETVVLGCKFNVRRRRPPPERNSVESETGRVGRRVFQTGAFSVSSSTTSCACTLRRRPPSKLIVQLRARRYRALTNLDER